MRAAVACLLALVLCIGCGGDDGGSTSADAETTIHVPRLYPTAKAMVESSGPLVPGTPGLRVPPGYFARARIHAVDHRLPYCLSSFLVGQDEAFLRLDALGETVDGQRTVFHAFVPLASVGGAEIGTLADLTLEKAALTGATATIRLPTSNGQHTYLVEIERLSFETVEESLLTGSLEGQARRGSRSTTSLPFELGFVAYRGPNTGMVGEEAPARE